MDFFGGGDWFNSGSFLDWLNAQGAEDSNFRGMPPGTTALALAGAAHGGKSLYDAYNTGAIASGGGGGTTVGPAGGPVPGPESGAGSALSKMSPMQLMQLGRMGTGMMNEGQQQVQPPGVVGPRQTRPIAPFYSIGQQGQDMRGLLY